MKKTCKLPLFMLIVLSLSACSLKYEDESISTADLPELIFRNVTFSRYKDNALSLSLSAESLEQYKKGDTAYASKANFQTWDSNKNEATRGYCGLLSIQGDAEIYKLFSNILIYDTEQNMTLRAQSLSWNGKTEQLVSGAKEKVTIIRDDLELSGTGFSASGVSRSFAFTNNVSGTINTKEEE